jgi:hypothetical protein
MSIVVFWYVAPAVESRFNGPWSHFASEAATSKLGPKYVSLNFQLSRRKKWSPGTLS